MELSLSKCKNLDLAAFQRGFENYDLAVFGNLSKNVDELMDLYNTLYTAYVHLIQATKWQFLMLLALSLFSNILVLFMFISELLRNSADSLPVPPLPQSASHACFVLGNVLVLCGPCLAGDQLLHELAVLKRLLASRIYENKMDKRSRVSARALLALTGAHGLGVSLLGMLRVDISLPLHYVSLLVTYLIILLQFQKVNRI
ncbi:hypothetical protein JYU34_001695 [Plutella xylostella]|uniref:Uncharacterized protein n=1 Tax=Plutella xylostella TaxID=51655 RepID=A0ABQ7R4M6_PLUXY|nr:hypothetical protein JYU34_001695 [Plutella xylostella]